MYPDKSLTLGIRSSDNPPMITITPHGAKLVIPGAIDFFITDESDDALALTLGIVNHHA